AKKWVYGDVAIDMIAGPSEVWIVADESAPADYVAADLLSQAEHDEAATAICITFSDKQAKAIQREIAVQLEKLERKDVAAASLHKNGRIVVTDHLEEAWDLVNEMAPEHLELMVRNASEHISNIKHAERYLWGIIHQNHSVTTLQALIIRCRQAGQQNSPPHSVSMIS